MGLRKISEVQISRREYHADGDTISEAVKEFMPKLLVGIAAGTKYEFKMVSASTGCELPDAELKIVMTTVMPTEGGSQ